MKFLLDTHIWLWSLLDPASLSSDVAQKIEHPLNELWLSPISLWETIVLTEKGKLKLKSNVFNWIHLALREVPFREASLNYEVAIQSRKIELPHQDPADRFIAATAQVYDLTLITADNNLIKLKNISILPNK